MVRDDMESGIVTSYKNKGIIIPELISLPFFLKSSNICLKNCFSDKFSLRKPGICISYGYKQSYVLYWLHHDSLYTKGFYCNIYLRNECLFFLGSWGMNRSAGQTNRVNREAVLVRFVCSALRFIPHEPRKKDTHSLYLQCVQQRPFLKFSEKSYKFKISTVMGI